MSDRQNPGPSSYVLESDLKSRCPEQTILIKDGVDFYYQYRCQILNKTDVPISIREGSRLTEVPPAEGKGVSDWTQCRIKLLDDNLQASPHEHLEIGCDKWDEYLPITKPGASEMASGLSFRVTDQRRWLIRLRLERLLCEEMLDSYGITNLKIEPLIKIRNITPQYDLTSSRHSSQSHTNKYTTLDHCSQGCICDLLNLMLMLLLCFSRLLVRSRDGRFSEWVKPQETLRILEDMELNLWLGEDKFVPLDGGDRVVCEMLASSGVQGVLEIVSTVTAYDQKLIFLKAACVLINQTQERWRVIIRDEKTSEDTYCDLGCDPSLLSLETPFPTLCISGSSWLVAFVRAGALLEDNERFDLPTFPRPTGWLELNNKIGNRVAILTGPETKRISSTITITAAVVFEVITDDLTVYIKGEHDKLRKCPSAVFEVHSPPESLAIALDDDPKNVQPLTSNFPQIIDFYKSDVHPQFLGTHGYDIRKRKASLWIDSIERKDEARLISITDRINETHWQRYSESLATTAESAALIIHLESPVPVYFRLEGEQSESCLYSFVSTASFQSAAALTIFCPTQVENLDLTGSSSGLQELAFLDLKAGSLTKLVQIRLFESRATSKDVLERAESVMTTSQGGARSEGGDQQDSPYVVQRWTSLNRPQTEISQRLLQRSRRANSIPLRLSAETTIVGSVLHLRLSLLVVSDPRGSLRRLHFERVPSPRWTDGVACRIRVCKFVAFFEPRPSDAEDEVMRLSVRHFSNDIKLSVCTRQVSSNLHCECVDLAVCAPTSQLPFKRCLASVTSDQVRTRQSESLLTVRAGLVSLSSGLSYIRFDRIFVLVPKTCVSLSMEDKMLLEACFAQLPTWNSSRGIDFICHICDFEAPAFELKITLREGLLALEPVLQYPSLHLQNIWSAEQLRQAVVGDHLAKHSAQQWYV